MADDTRWIEKAKRGSRAAAEELIRRYYDEISRYAFRQTGQKETAMDNATARERVVVKRPARAGAGGKLFGAVTSQEISEALKTQFGIEIEKQKIVQADPIKTFGSYEVKCKFGYEINGVIHVMVTEEK